MAQIIQLLSDGYTQNAAVKKSLESELGSLCQSCHKKNVRVGAEEVDD